MRGFYLLALIGLLGASALAQDAERTRLVAEVKSAMEKAKVQKVQAEAELKAMKAGRVSRVAKKPVERFETGGRIRYAFATAEAKAKAIADKEVVLQSIGRKESLMPVLDTPLAVGSIGRLPSNELREVDGRVTGGVHLYRVLQVVDDNNMIVSWSYSPVGFANRPPEIQSVGTLWISEPTDGLVDDKPLEPEGVYKVAGTKKYGTAAGSQNTVLLLEPFDAAEIIANAQAN